MKRYEAVYNGYRIILRATTRQVAISVAKKLFEKCLRLNRWEDMYFSIKEVEK